MTSTAFEANGGGRDGPPTLATSSPPGAPGMAGSPSRQGDTLSPPGAPLPDMPRPWSPKATWALRGVGFSALATMAVTVWLGLWVTPPSEVMHNLVRLVYIHPPIAWVALYLAFGALGMGSLLWLWPRTRSLVWDRVAAAAAEVGLVFTALTLVTGSIWGRPTWGVWWAWDARLTSTALLLVLLLGYLAIRRVPSDADTRARRSAVAALVAVVDVPIVYFSVNWWHTLHENTQVDIHGLMAVTMLLGFVSFTLAFVWMLATALRIQTLRAHLEDMELVAALADRHAESTAVGSGGDRAGEKRSEAPVAGTGVTPAAAGSGAAA
ncbi:MAG: cytochrome c biogenesis protein CcsA, partial [Actinomycetota bacterium]|nr:cytochrome c biogenesis protein CcsA [Actinomycetota bacterium]